MMFYQRRFMKYFGMMSKLHYAINKEEPSTSLKASGKFKKKKKQIKDSVRIGE